MVCGKCSRLVCERDFGDVVASLGFGVGCGLRDSIMAMLNENTRVLERLLELQSDVCSI
jgi:hypothetical protein